MRIENRKHLHLKQNILSFFIITLFILPLANAIKITPYIDAGELQHNKSYTYSIYIENDENAAKSITMKITPRASYLAQYVSITPRTFILDRNSAKNVIIELRTSSLPPGEHQLTIMPETSEAGGGVNIVSTFATTIRFSLPGNVTKSLIAEDVGVSINKDTATFTIKAKNNGNVRVSAFPAIEIWRGDSFLARIEGNTEYIIEPGITKNIESKYTASSNGKYRAIAFARYDGIASNKIEKEFEITSVPEIKINGSIGGSSGSGGPASSSSGSNKLNTSAPKVPTVNISGSAVENKERLKILKFTAEAKPVEPLVMLLSLENTDSASVNYEYIFEVTEGGTLLYTQTGSGTINGFETKEIKHSWLPEKPGNYTVRAAILYDGQLLEETKVVSILEKSENQTPTGLAVGEQSSILIAAAVLPILLIAFFVWRKRRLQHH